MGCGASKVSVQRSTNLVPGETPPSSNLPSPNQLPVPSFQAEDEEPEPTPALSNLTTDNLRAHVQSQPDADDDDSKDAEDLLNGHQQRENPRGQRPSLALTSAAQFSPRSSRIGSAARNSVIDNDSKAVRSLNLAYFQGAPSTVRKNISRHVEYYLATAETACDTASVSDGRGSVAGAHAESDKNSYASTMRMHDEDQGPPPRFSINVKFLRRALVSFRLIDPQDTGLADYEMFLAVLGTDDSALAKKLFNALDEAQCGKINYRQMIIAFVDFSNTKGHLQHATLCFDVVDVQEQGFLTTEDVSQFLTWRNALNDVHKADIDYEVNALVRQLHVPTDTGGSEGAITLRLDHFTKLLRLFPHIVLAEPCFERRLDKRMYKDMKHDIRRVHFMADSVCRMMSCIRDPEDNPRLSALQQNAQVSTQRA